MDRASSSAVATRPAASGRIAAAGLICALDRFLQKRQRIFEFTDDPACVFRIQLHASNERRALSDGALVRPGDRIVALHFWNEHLPAVPRGGASIGWAREMSHGMRSSLRALAAYLAARPELDDVCAVHAEVTWATREHMAQLARMCRYLGFDIVMGRGPVALKQRVRRLGENILVSLLVFAHNGAALRADTLRRERVEIFMSRKALDRRYGAAGDGALVGKRDA
jgi:hypothetical protein